MKTPFRNPFEKKMRNIIRDIKMEKPVRRDLWVHKDVLEDIRCALEYALKLKRNMGDALSHVVLFGGVMRTPYKSHSNSDIDLMVIQNTREKPIQPENRRISTLIYGKDFLNTMIGDSKPESSFIRTTFLQAHATLVGDENEIESLRLIAQKNFHPKDLVSLIRHMIKKHRLDITEKDIQFVMEKLGVMPWVYDSIDIT